MDNRKHKHFTIAGDESLLAIMSYTDTEDSKKAKKEFDNNFNVNYCFIKKSLEILLLKDTGTGKVLRQKKREFETSF